MHAPAIDLTYRMHAQKKGGKFQFDSLIAPVSWISELLVHDNLNYDTDLASICFI